MLKLYGKILRTPKTVIPKEEMLKADIGEIGTKLKGEVSRLFRGSLAIREVDCGSSNAEEQELTALSNCYYDCERFGIHFVASPRHADMLLITGPGARNMAEPLRHAYEATPEPRIIVAVGDDAIDGGIFRGSYAVCDGIKNIIPVDYEIPGDPPSPKIVLASLLTILQDR